MDLFNLSGVISLNADKFNKQAEEADKKGKKLGERLKDITDTAAGRLLSRGIEELGSAIVGVSKKAIQLAGDLEQNLGGALAVFGEENFWALEKAGKQAFKSMGISYSDFLQRANKMGSLLQGSGIETTKSMEMSVEWMQRASDVASIMGIDVGDAMQAIEGAAKGNFTMMDNLGVAMNATTLEAYRLEKGLSKPYAKMTQGEKVMLAYDMFMERTRKYQGNYAKENDTLAGSLTTLNAAWENLLAGVGDGTEVWESAEVALGQIWKTAQKVLPKIWNSMRNALKKNWPKIADQMGQFLRNLPQTLTDVAVKGANGLIDIINSTFGSNIPHIKDIKLPTWEEIKTGAITALNKVIGKINGWFGTKIPEIKDIHIPTWEEIKKTGETALNKVIEGINGFFGLNLPKLGTPEFPDWSTIVQAATDWWNDNQIGQGITGICNWVLGWFDGTPGSEMDTETKTILSNWWGKISGAITDACNWVLGWFVTPEGTFENSPVYNTVTTWWGKISEAVTGACTWALGWFTNGPEGTFAGSTAETVLKQWWSDASSAITNACNWVLGIFQNPTEDQDAVQSKIRSWWYDSQGWVENACEWVLKLFGLPKETEENIKEYVGSWWSGLRNTAESAITWVASLPKFETSNEAGLALHDRIAKWWDDIKDTATKGIDFVVGLFRVDDPDGKTIIDHIQDYWDTKVKPQLKLSVDFVVGVLGYKNFDSMMVDFKYTMTKFLYDSLDMIPGLREALGLTEKYEALERNYAIDKRVAAGDLSEEGARNLYGILNDLHQLKGTGNAQTMMGGWLFDQLFGEGFTDKLSEIAEGGFTDFDSMLEAANTVSTKLQELYDASDTEEGFAALKAFMDATGYNADNGVTPEKYKEFAQNTLEVLKSITENPVAVEADTKPAETAVAGLVKDINGTSATMTVYTNFVGGVKDGEDDGEESHGNNAKGLDYVPNNGYISELHRGEAILSGNEARAWRENGGRGQNYGGAGEVVAAIQSLGNDISNMRMFVGERAFGGVVVDYGGRGMGNYLGASSKRRRRGYGRT